ncbi:MFS transporter [Pasteurella multocida]|uniref:MFS transporter n=1 Tax=Pasteurella multocida TaxID=747 RepID=UPI00397A6757
MQNEISLENKNIWANRSFITLYSTAFFVNMGVKIYALALPLLMYELTGSSEVMGWVRAVEFVPHIFLAAIIGVVVDRFNKKHWSLIMLLGQVLILAITWLSVSYMRNPLWLLIPNAFLMMALDNAYNNARMTMIKQVIPSHQLNTATARMGGLYSFFDAVGPFIAGGIFLFSSIHNSFLVVIAVIIFSALVLLRLDYNEVIDTSHPPILTSLKSGWRILRENRPMWLISLAIMFLNATGSVFTLQVIFFAKDTLTLSDAYVGYLFALSGLGGVIGSVLSDKLRLKIGLGRLFIYTIALEALGFIAVAIFPTTLSLALSLFWTSTIGIMTSICVWTYRQEAFEKNVMGKITGITGMISKLGMPVSLVLSGYIVNLTGTATIFLICALVQLGVTLVIWCSPVRQLS